MTERVTPSPLSHARITGLAYVLYFLTAILAVVLLRGIVVAGDAGTTARNIMAHEALFRSGFAIGLVATALHVVVTALLYVLLSRVNKSIALLAAFFSLVGCAIQASRGVFQIAPLEVLGGSQYLDVFRAEQLHALALMFLKLNAQAGYIDIIFFGLFDLSIGYLIFRSTFLPRTLGVLMALAGLGWLTFLSPWLAAHLSSYVDVLGFIAEALLMGWLLIKGVNTQRWENQAEA